MRNQKKEHNHARKKLIALDRRMKLSEKNLIKLTREFFADVRTG